MRKLKIAGLLFVGYTIGELVMSARYQRRFNLVPRHEPRSVKDSFDRVIIEPAKQSFETGKRLAEKTNR